MKRHNQVAVITMAFIIISLAAGCGTFTIVDSENVPSNISVRNQSSSTNVLNNLSSVQTNNAAQSRTNSIPTIHTLHGSIQQLKMISPSTGFALVQTKSGLALFRTEDGGVSWNQTFPKSATHVENVLDMTYLGKKQWLVARQTKLMAGTQGESGTLQFLSTKNNGQTWHKLSEISTPMTDPSVQNIGFSMLSGTNGYAMVHPAHAMGNEPGVLYRTTDGGQHWSKVSQNVYPKKGSKPTLPFGGTIRFVTADDGWLLASPCTTCSGKLYWTTDQGRSWAKVKLNVPTQFSKNKISLLTVPFPSGTAGVYYSSGFSRPKKGLPSSFLFKFSSLSKTGQFVAKIPGDVGGISYINSRPSNIDFVTKYIGYEIATTHGYTNSGLYMTSDGGVTWHQVQARGLPSQQNAQGNLQSIDFINKTVGWIVWSKNSGKTTEDIVYKTTDGGRDFKRIAVTQWISAAK